MDHWYSNLSWQSAKERAEFLARIRTFFFNKDVIEVETPLLSQGTVTDVYLDAFTTKYSFLPDQTSVDLYLQTSPEFAMKRLLASGYGSIYQICKAFRNEPYGKHHNPEFTILEWYRIGFTYQQLIAEIDQLLCELIDCQPAEQVSYQALFLNRLAVDPLTISKAECLALIKHYDIASAWLEDAELDTLLQYLFCQLIEPNIGLERPCFVYHFPASQASLAKIDEQDPRVAKRFECYFKGLELLNGFEELTDGDLQLARFKQDNANRAAQGLPVKPIDERFIAALSKGLPDCSGVAIGLDRLFMILQQAEEIKHCVSFNINNA